MSGLLEQLLERMERLETLLTASTSEDVPSAPVVEQTTGAVATITTTVEADPYAGVDADGVVWNKDIHSKAAEPKAASGKWKRRKGVSDEVFDTAMAELKSQPVYWVADNGISGRADNADEFVKLVKAEPSTRYITEGEFREIKPTTTTPVSEPTTITPVSEPTTITPFSEPAQTTAAPTVPSAPVAPVSRPTAPVTAPVSVDPGKAECLRCIKQLGDDYDVDPADITSVMVANGGFDTMDKIQSFDNLKLALSTWLGNLVLAKGAIEEMQAIAAKHGFTDNLNEGIQTILEPFNAEVFSNVHPDNLTEVCNQLDDYLNSWKELA